MPNPQKPPRRSDKDWVGDARQCKCGDTVFSYSAYVLGNFGRSLESTVNPDGRRHQCKEPARG